MIILEGIDCGGKTTLMNKLQDKFQIHVAPRFSTSVEGPKDNLDELVIEDMNQWDKLDVRLYDRHPFISEFIYGPVIRGKVKDNLDRRELIGHRAFFDHKTLLIVCLPDFDTVLSNLIKDPDNQMEGVGRHLDRLYAGYQRLLQAHPAEPVWYDYTVHDTAYVESMVSQHIYEWRH